MDLVYNDCTFYVNSIKGNREVKNRLYFSVDVEFADEADIASHAVDHVIWGLQNSIREDLAIARGEVEAPKGYKPIALKPVAQFKDGKVPDKWTAKATGILKSDGKLRPSRAEEEAAMKASIERLKATDPEMYERMKALFMA